VTPNPWESRSEYNQLSKALMHWEQNLPTRHQWSVRNLRGYKAESLDLVRIAHGGISLYCSTLNSLIHLGISSHSHGIEAKQYCPAENLPS
jgi:hypothetical protein